MKNCLILVTFLIFSTPAIADTENFCGLYSEENSQSYLTIPRDDIAIGSRGCSARAYRRAIEKSGTARIALDFNRRRYTASKWQKFSGRLIEIRGKTQNGYISNVRLIREISQ